MEPTGAVRDVGVEDLFFSVTDHKGIIRQVNATFARLSATSREDLVGHSHNVVRHPMMPGGAFRMMWDRLLAGRPFVGYVHNLAADGVRYDVFATITPLPDGGFLSVRTAPLVEDSFVLMSMLYEATCDLEYQLRSDGMSRADAATRGADHLQGLIEDGGMGSYDEVMLGMLPAEVSTLEAALGGLPERPQASGPLREMLEELRSVFADLTVLMVRLDPISELMRDMGDAVYVLQGTIDRSTALAAMIAAKPELDDQFESLVEPLRRWMSMGGEMDALMHALMAEMGEVREVAARSRFLIALARLHQYMTGYYLAELIDRKAGSEEALPAVGLLCEALESGFRDLETQAPVHLEAVDRAIVRIEDAAQLLQAPSRVMAEWDAVASQRDLPGPVADLLPQIEAELEASDRAVRQLRAIGARCADSGAPADTAALRAGAARISGLAQGLASAGA
ncbi:aerotaxis receptor [Raineyella antarctica]|uniref:Aerotaxis receptor n=1 Tax=Raineyella antarctica TaxID=1577474 RepID=A0A1G6IJF2_9ACTN|nr:PAS domain-containing protein [Raineyella antarctica]SDC06722.1 aerotaxis receptor [Raineyella antarctica]